jgi:hypothetical protein
VSDYQVGHKVTLVIRNLVCATFVALLAGVFANPVQAQSDELTISSVRVTNSPAGKKHTVEISGTFTTDMPAKNTHLDLVTFGPLRTRSELAQVLADPHLSRGTAHTDISVKLETPNASTPNSVSLRFDGDKALGSSANGVYVFGLVKRGSALQTNYVQPWFYQSNQIQKTKVVFLTQLSVENRHLADGKAGAINSDAISLVRLNNLLDHTSTTGDFVLDPAIDNWLADLQKSALKPAANEIKAKLDKTTQTSATQIYNHTDLQSLFADSPSDIWPVLRLSPTNSKQPLLYFPKYGQINYQTMSQLGNVGKVIPVLSNTFIGKDPYQTTNVLAQVNNRQSLIYDAGISRCLSRQDSIRATECVAANVAMITAESPYQGRTVAVVTPPFWNAQPGELSAILANLSNNKFSDITSLQKALHSNTYPATFNIVGAAKQFPAGLVRQGKRLSTRAGVLGSAIESDNFIPAFELARLRSFSELFPKAQSEKYFLKANEALLERVRSSIAIKTSSRITVASARTEIPLTISNLSNNPIRVKASVTSASSSRFTSAPSDVVSIPKGARVTVPVKIHFKGTGSISVKVRLTNAKNQDLGITQDISVASSSYQSLARTLVWGACGLLVLFAIVNAARKRRGGVTE